MIVPPAWINAGFRLIEGGRMVDWPALDAAARALETDVRSGAPAVVLADGAGRLIAALVAAERAGVPLQVQRRAGTPPVDAGAGFGVVLQTSGTTGAPKAVRHEFSRLQGRLRSTGDATARWLLAYEPGAFAGIQVVLTALAAGATLVVPEQAGPVGAVRAMVAHGVTHASATPSFWRAALLALGEQRPPLRSITLGGEPADQGVLDRLAERFPAARLRHVYASTEAGALFSVGDGRAGFPAAWLETGIDGVSLRLRDGVLEAASPRAMLGAEGRWLDTGDLVEIQGDRVLFAGRRDGRVNIGGVKVSPEAVERRLLAVPGVAEALVSAAANPITGHILTATVVPAPGADTAALRGAVREAMTGLEPAARPRLLTLADAVDVTAAGKKWRGTP